MDNVKNDTYYLEKLNHHFKRIMTIMENKTYDAFVNDIDAQEICMFNLIQISELTKNLSEKYKKSNPDIPWTDISGLRNRIVHDYGNVVLDIVYDTLTQDIQDLYAKLF